MQHEHWVLCPICGSKTRTKIRSDSVLENFVFLFVGFHMQIAVYIGVQRLVQQLLIVLAILDVLLISYFISTWVLFNKSASA